MLDSKELDDRIAKLVLARDIFQRTGLLQEVQRLNLQMLPIAIMDDDKATTEVDTEDRTVKVFLHNTKRSKIFEEKMKNLSTAIQFVLGDDFQVQVISKKNPLNTMFRLRRKEAKSTYQSLELEKPLSNKSKPRF